MREHVLLYFRFFERAKKAEDLELTCTTKMFLFGGNFLMILNTSFRHILTVTYLFKDREVPVSCPLLN